MRELILSNVLWVVIVITATSLIAGFITGHLEAHHNGNEWLRRRTELTMYTLVLLSALAGAVVGWYRPGAGAEIAWRVLIAMFGALVAAGYSMMLSQIASSRP